MLRDPVERYRCGLAHDLARGATFGPELAQDHFARGLYHAQLVRLLQHFPREHLLVLQYERCVAGPEPELERTYEDLGVDPSFRPDRVDDHVMETKLPKPALDAGRRRPWWRRTGRCGQPRRRLPGDRRRPLGELPRRPPD